MIDIGIGLGYLGAAIGAGLCVIGGGLGLGRIGSALLDADARQPSEASQLKIFLFLAAALVEGIALFGMVLCLILILTLNGQLPK